MDHFEFLQKVQVDDEVLTSGTGDRMHKVTGVGEKHISIEKGFLFDRETGLQICGGKKQSDVMIQYLSPEKKKEIEKKEGN